ncbi:contractile injection system protein, VgrG/Pvc8 family [Marinomonas transparens]|uniref:Uncharacterized protein n=1 Tax=Marinomonas transparens TaxID=2795388 RepID=A0A934JSL9_9GAMM|nr:contractile injection system protein, VgrG/Pvc8 family [Marinomonas transparens]MBJ7539998.1 hypothetical protein [Marinomonas transparens]
MANVEKTKGLPLDYMAIELGRQHVTSLSLSIVAGPAGQLLNSDYIRVISVEGQEQVSQPYRFTISLRANENNTLAPSQQPPASHFAALPDEPYPQEDLLTLVQGNSQMLLGQWARVTLGYEYHSDEDNESGPSVEENFSTGQELPPRHFSGIISSISQSAPGEYSAELQSPLFPLTLRNRYFVFKGLNIANLIKALIQPELSRYANTFAVDCTRLQGVVATRVQDWMQAGETDFAMLQRVMKKAAAHFYFIHAADKLTVVFSNQTTGPDEVSIPSTETGSLALRYSYTDAQSLGLQQSDLFCNLSYKMQMVPKTVGAALVRQEAVWETNNVAEYDSFPALSDVDGVNYLFYKNYSYGVDKAEAEEAKLQIEQEVATQQGTLTGESTSNLLSPGYTFTLTQVAINPKDTSLVGNEQSLTPITANNLMPAQFDGQTFVVTKITHKVTEHTPYSGTIEATSVSTNTKQSDATFITPFDIQDTHQGSVLATVLESAVPKNPYFFEKNNFSTELSHVEFDDQQQSQIGCLVRFATDEGTDVKHWVALSDTSQTAPAVNSMVMIGRGGDESEIPQIQQVVSSHGQKTIQPALWRNNSWTFNTNWGSSCSTSYGDSMNIHFGSEATPDLKTAMNIVQTAYSNSSVLAANFGGTSYSKGCSFSYSTTEKGAKGLANASVSQGSHFSESHSEQDYSVGYTNTRQSFSKTNKSVNVSYQGAFTDTVDEENLNFISGKIPNQDIIDICEKLPDGSSYNQSHITGKSVNLSGTGASPPDFLDTPGLVSYSNSKTVGAVVNNSVTMGAVTNNSVTVGATSNATTNNGAMSNITNNNGIVNNVSVTTGLSSSNDTFLGGKIDTTIFGGLRKTINIHNFARVVEGTHTALYTIDEKNLLGRKEIITTTGDYNKTVSTSGVVNINYKGSPCTVTMDGLNLTVKPEMTVTTPKLTVTADTSAEVNAPELTVTAKTSAEVKAAKLTITADTSAEVNAPELTVTAKTSAEVKAAKLTITADTSAEVNAPELTVTAKTSAEVKAAELKMTADATMKLSAPDLKISSPALTVDSAKVTFTSSMVVVM